MSVLASGKGKCDRCGWLGANSGIHLFIVINALAPDGGVLTLHYCRPEEGNGCSAIISEAATPLSKEEASKLTARVKKERESA